MSRIRHTAGDYWRAKGDREADTAALGPFDEIVVGEREFDAWLHVEMMNDRSAFVQIADRCFWVYIPSKGAPRITSEETRPWRQFKRCRRRPGGRRCIMRNGHRSDCYAPLPRRAR